MQREMKASIHANKTNPIKIPQQAAVATQSQTNGKHSEESFFQLLRSYYNKTPTHQAADSVDSCVPINAIRKISNAPHFDIIANDPDVDSLVLSSKMLLNSVSNTLRRVQIELSEEQLGISDSLLENDDESNEEPQYLDGSDCESVQTEKVECKETLESLESVEQRDAKSEIRKLVQLPKAILRRWFREIIFAVKHLHANEIFCYDLQPHNLLLGKNGEVLLTYFYRRELNGYIDLKSLNKTCYPLAYIAPERPLTQLSDVWSIGVIFYELATGTPFQLCHPNGIHSYYDIQYSEDCGIDGNTKDLLEGVRQPFLCYLIII